MTRLRTIVSTAVLATAVVMFSSDAAAQATSPPSPERSWAWLVVGLLLSGAYLYSFRDLVRTGAAAREGGAMGARAEFRVFGRDVIAGVEAHMWNGRSRLQQIRNVPVETYVLSRRTNDANVKVRDGLLDIKIKTATTPEGYEVFTPIAKYQFPVTREQLKVITDALEIDWTDARASWTFDEFRDAASRHPQLALVQVEKTRHGFEVDGVTCEFAKVWFNGALVETACVESEDHARMGPVIEALGLTGAANTNYLTAAKRVIGMEPVA